MYLLLEKASKIACAALTNIICYTCFKVRIFKWVIYCFIENCKFETYKKKHTPKNNILWTQDLKQQSGERVENNICCDYYLLYRVKKMSQIQNRFKIGYLQNDGYQQQPAANIGHQTCIWVNFVFICSIL